MGRWKEVARLDPRRSCDDRLRTRHVSVPNGKSYTVVEVYDTGMEDIMDECTASLIKSRHSDGYYCGVNYKGRIILALGIDKVSRCIIDEGFVIERAKGATVSFRISKIK